ncbi:hypothetical protein A0H81_05786 [Grifola frondosa]|uniref:Uncharacterized protein n=1 Tax=Grifola frondosa TaxID=5627 RepID=A0A1C7MCH9_GRIFR|nr:hypothetical protein A0H81_05786 [Grifola frondosa]
MEDEVRDGAGKEDEDAAHKLLPLPSIPSAIIAYAAREFQVTYAPINITETFGLADSPYELDLPDTLQVAFHCGIPPDLRLVRELHTVQFRLLCDAAKKRYLQWRVGDSRKRLTDTIWMELQTQIAAWETAVRSDIGHGDPLHEIALGWAARNIVVLSEELGLMTFQVKGDEYGQAERERRLLWQRIARNAQEEFNAVGYMEVARYN